MGCGLIISGTNRRKNICQSEDRPPISLRINMFVGRLTQFAVEVQVARSSTRARCSALPGTSICGGGCGGARGNRSRHVGTTCTDTRRGNSLPFRIARLLTSIDLIIRAVCGSIDSRIDVGMESFQSRDALLFHLCPIRKDRCSGRGWESMSSCGHGGLRCCRRSCVRSLLRRFDGALQLCLEASVLVVFVVGG